MNVVHMGTSDVITDNVWIYQACLFRKKILKPQTD